MFGYTEPFRKFVQREDFTPQANEIPNTAPSWLPGDDYYTNFHSGDPSTKMDEGYARLPGAGYAALRHANSRITLDIYQQSVSEEKQQAQELVFWGLLEGVGQLSTLEN
jgi:hypothetical protein